MGIRIYKYALPLGALRLFLGIFFLILGICGIFTEIDETIFSLVFQGYTWLEVVFGIVDMACGVLILSGFLIFSGNKPVFMGSFIAFICWLARIVLTSGVRMMRLISYGSNDFWVDFFNMLLIFLCELVIAAAIFVLVKRYD